MGEHDTLIDSWRYINLGEWDKVGKFGECRDVNDFAKEFRAVVKPIIS